MVSGQIQIEYWEDTRAFQSDPSGKPLGLLSSTRKASEALGPPIYSCWGTLLGK